MTWPFYIEWFNMIFGGRHVEYWTLTERRW